MKKAIVLTADKFEDMEVMYPLFRLQEEGWQVDVAAQQLLYFNPSLPQFSNVTDVLKDLYYCLKTGLHTSVRRGELR